MRAAAMAKDDIVCPATVTVLRPAANGAGVVSSRGTHGSFPLFFEVVFFAIGFDEP